MHQKRLFIKFQCIQYSSTSQLKLENTCSLYYYSEYWGHRGRIDPGPFLQGPHSLEWTDIQMNHNAEVRVPQEVGKYPQSREWFILFRVVEMRYWERLRGRGGFWTEMSQGHGILRCAHKSVSSFLFLEHNIQGGRDRHWGWIRSPVSLLSTFEFILILRAARRQSIVWGGGRSLIPRWPLKHLPPYFPRIKYMITSGWHPWSPLCF